MLTTSTMLDYLFSLQSKQKSIGITKTQQIWTWRKEEENRQVAVLPHCKVFRREIRRYFFDKTDKPMDRDDHMMENLYRLCYHDSFNYRPQESGPASKISFKPEEYDLDDFGETDLFDEEITAANWK